MTFNFSAKSTGAEVARALSQHIKGKTILITGGSVGGIGLECATEIAKHSPKSIILTARTQDKLDEAFAHIREKVSDATLTPVVVDLSSMQDVRRAASQLNQTSGAIDVLLHNAGVAGINTRTADDLPTVYASNVYGPFLLTKLLLPRLLESTQKPRVIFIAGGQATAEMRFRSDDPYYKNVPDNEKFNAYSESKIANWLLASAVARKSGGKVVGTVTSPGWVASQLSRNLPRAKKIEMGFIDENGVQNPAMRSLQQGCAPYIFSAYTPDESYVNGAFISSNCAAAPENVPAGGKGKDLEDGLWAACEQVVGEKFEF